MKKISKHIAPLLFLGLLFSSEIKGQGFTTNGTTTTTTDQVGIGTKSPIWPFVLEVPSSNINLPSASIGLEPKNKQVWFFNNVKPSWSTNNSSYLSNLPGLLQEQDQALIWTDGQMSSTINYPAAGAEPGDPSFGSTKVDGNGIGGFVIAPMSNDMGGIRIDKDGHVGMSEPNPMFPLHVNGTAKFNNNIIADDIYSSNGLNGWDITARGHIFTPSIEITSELKLKNSKILMYDANNVLQTKIEPSGSMWIRELTADVNTIPPDYVFEKDYKMLNLEQLNQYLVKNKHLPNVPSASEMLKAKSINIVDMEMKLLEKVEELTLYVISVNEKNILLEKELNDLKQKIKN